VGSKGLREILLALELDMALKIRSGLCSGKALKVPLLLDLVQHRLKWRAAGRKIDLNAAIMSLEELAGLRLEPNQSERKPNSITGVRL
jgi:hypothetical protein